MALSERNLKILNYLFWLLPLAGVAVYLSYIFFNIIVLLIISLFIAMIFYPLVNLLENKGLNRFLSVILVFIVCGMTIFIGLSFFIPKIVNQLNTIATTFSQEQFRLMIIQLENEIAAYLPFVDSKDLLNRVELLVSNFLFDAVNNITGIVSSIVSVLVISVIVPFITFFILKDSNKILRGIVNIVPNRYFEFSYWVLFQTGIQLSRFIRGWMFDAFIVGFLAAVGLAILGIQNSITIGVIAGVGHLIPYFGPIIGGLPAILISLIQFGDFSMFPQVFLLFVIIYSIDNGFIQPNVFSKATDMHPLMIILLILVGGQLMGVLGLLLAVPAATILKTAAREIYFGYKNYKIIKA